MFHSEVQGFRETPIAKPVHGGRGADIDQEELEQEPSVNLHAGPLLRETKALGKLVDLKCRRWVIQQCAVSWTAHLAPGWTAQGC